MRAAPSRERYALEVEELEHRLAQGSVNPKRPPAASVTGAIGLRSGTEMSQNSLRRIPAIDPAQARADSETLADSIWLAEANGCRLCSAASREAVVIVHSVTQPRRNVTGLLLVLPISVLRYPEMRRGRQLRREARLSAGGILDL